MTIRGNGTNGLVTQERILSSRNSVNPNSKNKITTTTVDLWHEGNLGRSHGRGQTMHQAKLT